MNISYHPTLVNFFLLLDVGVDVAKENDKYAEQFAKYGAHAAKAMLTALMREGFSRKEALQLILARMGQQSTATGELMKGAGALNGTLSRNKPPQ